MNVDWEALANIIFKEKEKYSFVSDDEKYDAFFKLNRKFAFKFLKQAQFFNNKKVDRVSAIDIWYCLLLKNIGIPAWYWKTNVSKEKKHNFKPLDLKNIKARYGLTDGDINFLIKYKSDNLKEEISRIKKFKKEKD